MAVHFILLCFLFLGTPASSASTTSLATNATADGSPARQSSGSGNVTTFSFSGFHPDLRGANLTVVGDASINQGALQITPDTGNNAANFLANKSGRILYSDPFRLWRAEKGAGGGKKLASFSAVFTVNVYRFNGTEPAEGFAFLIAPSADAPPPGSYGGFLGLTNAATDGNGANQIVAVELDTEKQPYDQDDNHVGLNVNSVVSVANASLTPLGIEISPIGTAKYNLWIDYDGAARRIAVYMADVSKPKPASPVLASDLDLGATVAEKSYFGFAASTGRKYQLNCVLAWNMTVENIPWEEPGKSKSGLVLGLAVGVPVAVFALAAAAAFGYYYLCVVKRRKVDRDEGGSGSVITGTMIRSLAGGPREFDYRELRKATSNFDERMKLGQGGYGVVYRGVVVEDHNNPAAAGTTVEVAVKKFSRASTQGQNDFLSELSIINRLRHKHLVRLVGWSHDDGELLLVYEYMPNGSLDQHLFSSAAGSRQRQPLGWELRYSIVQGVASALHYLHDQYDQRVVHRDLKASNIMLDAAFTARLGDFGLARAIETDKTSYMEEVAGGVHGTVGYIAPECFHTEKATRESDVYAFGAVILETVCGRRPRCDIDGFHFLVDWVWRLHRDGRALEAVDPSLDGAYDEDDAERLLMLGLACSHPTPAERPKAQAISQILLRAMPTPHVPPFKPSFVWPATDGGFDTMSTTAGTTSSQVSTVMTSSSAGSGNFTRGSQSHAPPAPEQDTSGSLV
ncbi:probable L-type lectin-domain containing receptor kinase S.5 [Lolium perenne]|uniref:probable L-type lectin-domain containing receptor kinase S.5 n=1 Tax=Lolium perenne TaxID=4522 RepID=UPI0021EAE318|nr:probable L-type lectin-domain containing receptor kinase S.5 [Lolium perenne]